jgi:hypothetical protein
VPFFQPLHRRPWADDRFGFVVSRGYIQLVRHSGAPPLSRGHPRALQPLTEVDIPDEPDPAGADDIDGQSSGDSTGDDDVVLGRGDRGQSRKSRNNMRRLFLSLPWELLGRRPAMVSLTYPGDWRRWAPNGRVLEAHRRAFERRWVRRWGEPLVGVWVKEFQASGRPHMHLYIGLPSGLSDDDFEGLRKRTLMRHRLERSLGRYQGRGALPPINKKYGGEFSTWIREAWTEIVGTWGVDRKHHVRGVDVAVMFWSEEVAATADRTRVAAYLAKEASKWRQKQPPEASSEWASTSGAGAARWVSIRSWRRLP